MTSQRRRYLSRLAVIALALALALTGCESAPKPAPARPAEPASALVRLSPSDYPDFFDDLNYEGLEHAIDGSIAYLQRLPPEREFEFGRDRFTAAHVLQSLREFRGFIQVRPPSRALQQYISARCLVYRSTGRDRKGEVLFTGYFEPRLKGSRNVSPGFRYPIFGRPDDLVTVELGAFAEKYRGEKLIGRLQERTVLPYYDRREIEEGGVLFGKSQPIAWVSDPVELFFLHVQGSGKILFEDGRSINVGYEASNGRPYQSVAQLLIDEGKISREEMSMQRIRAFLNENPAEIQRVLNHNPSFVFFKETPDGPLGSLNVKLTPGRSVALDRKLFPPAALTFIATQKPLIDGFGNITSWVGCRRLALNQDTGGAILGPGRADLFWGSGPYAEMAAGHLKHTGSLYVIVLKPDGPSP
jgi:membrane-bound lytic murein transglycosylase A